MGTLQEEAGQLIDELKEAKIYLLQLEGKLSQRQKIRDELTKCDKKVESLEKRAKSFMKTVGCVSSEAREVHRIMADMLIAWHTVKDKIPG